MIRDLDPDALSPVERAACLIYLNKTCYNGLYRVNRWGKFNVPFGSYENPLICDEEGLRAASFALKSNEVRGGDFEEITFNLAKPGDFIYLDPPYYPLSDTANFTGYIPEGFGKREQERLADIYKGLDELGCYLMLSNFDTPFIRELYRGFLIQTVEAGRAINSKAKGRGKIISVLFLFLLLILPSSQAYTESRDIWQVQEATLPNGLRVLLLEDHRAPTVTFQVWYKVGSRNEHSGITGISHLLEHMMFRGAKKYGPDTFSKTVQRNGGDDNAFTTEDYTVYFENIVSDRLDIVLDLESDRMADLLLDPKLFPLERNVVMEERRFRTEDDPVSDLIEEVGATAFKVHPYHSPVIGWMSDLMQITREDLYNYYKTYYSPNNATLIVMGDFKAEELLTRIEESFGHIKSGSPPPKVRSVEPQQRGERRVTLRREAQLPFVAVAYHTPNFTSPESFTLEVLSSVLAQGDSSRMHKSLVYDKQIALSIGGDYSRISVDPRSIYFYAQVMPGKSPDEVESAFYEEIERIKKEPVSEYELQKAKNQLETSFIFLQDSLFGRGLLIGQYETLGDWKLVREYIPGIRAVTTGDIMNVARNYLTRDNRTVGILIPKKPES